MARGLLHIVLTWAAAGCCLHAGAQPTDSSAAGAHRRAPVDTLARIIRQPSNGRTNRGVFHYLFVPARDWMAGTQLSYGYFSSDESDYLMLVRGLTARGGVVKVTPFFGYFYRNNQALGAQFTYQYLHADVDAAELNIDDEDLNFSLDDLQARQRTYSVSLFQRSYIGLDVRGRFGLFNETALTYSMGRTVFAYDERTRESHTRNRRLSVSLHPGLAVFIMNNVSIHASIGVGGLNYNVMRYFEHGRRAGRRTSFKANFKVDITDIKIGMTIHFWKNSQTK